MSNFSTRDIITVSPPEAPLIMIFSPQGHGKSGFIESVNNPFVIDTENKFRLRPGKKGAVVRPDSLQKLEGALQWVSKLPILPPGHPERFGCVALDSIDWVEDTIHKKILSDYPTATNIIDDKIKDLNFQKGYIVACNEFFKGAFPLLQEIRLKHGMPIIITSQAKECKFDEADKGGEYFMQDLRLQEMFRNKISDVVHAKVYLQKYENIDSKRNMTPTERRYIITRRARGVNAKNCLDLPEIVDISYSNGFYEFANACYTAPPQN